MSELPPDLTPSQWTVMRAVWKTEPTTVHQVLKALAEEDRRDYRTIQTFLYQLKDKGYVDFHLEGKVAIFVSRVDRPTGFRVHVRRYFGHDQFRGDLEDLAEVLSEVLKDEAPRKTGKGKPKAAKKSNPKSAEPEAQGSPSPANRSGTAFPWQD
jgi:predicted transcriptional regulator